MALFLADPDTGEAAEARQAALDRGILAIHPVAGERLEVVDQPGDVVAEVRALGMPGDLRLLPGGQAGVGLAQQPLRLGLQLLHLLLDVDLGIVRQVTQFLDLAFEFRDRFFEIQEVHVSDAVVEAG